MLREHHHHYNEVNGILLTNRWRTVDGTNNASRSAFRQRHGIQNTVCQRNSIGDNRIEMPTDCDAPGKKNPQQQKGDRVQSNFIAETAAFDWQPRDVAASVYSWCNIRRLHSLCEDPFHHSNAWVMTDIKSKLSVRQWAALVIYEPELAWALNYDGWAKCWVCRG